MSNLKKQAEAIIDLHDTFTYADLDDRSDIEFLEDRLKKAEEALRAVTILFPAITDDVETDAVNKVHEWLGDCEV